MLSSLRNIGLLILMVIILPMLVFSVFEIGNLRQNEKVIQDIYRNQLDAILYSINQWSDDYMSNLASRIESISNYYQGDTGEELARLINETPSVSCLIQFDSTIRYLSSVPGSCRDSLSLSEMTTRFVSSDSTLKRLRTYMRGGYRKIETIGNKSSHMQWIVFLTKIRDQDVINALVIDPELFISQLLDPKLQEIAKGKFHIVAFREGEDNPFYISNKQSISGKITIKKPFWLLRGYEMGIELKEFTLADLARERTKEEPASDRINGLHTIIGCMAYFQEYQKNGGALPAKERLCFECFS